MAKQKTLSAQEKLDVLSAFLGDAGDQVAHSDWAPETTEGDVPSESNIGPANDEEPPSAGLPSKEDMLRAFGPKPEPEVPKKNKRNKATLTYKLTDISGVDPLADAIENDNVRYTLSIKAAKDDVPFKELVEKGLVTGVNKHTDHGTTTYTANIDTSLNTAIAESGLEGANLLLPETISLQNISNISVAYQAVSDKIDGEEPVLVIRGRAPDVTRFFKSNNLGATGNLHQCPDSEDSPNPEYMATCRLSEEVLEAIRKGSVRSDGSDMLLPLRTLLEEDIEIPEFADAFGLRHFAANHVASPHRKKKKLEQPEQDSKETKESAKPLDSYVDGLQECTPLLSSQLRIDGSTHQYIEVSAEHRDAFERLNAALTDSRKTNPSLSIDRSPKKIIREEEPFFRYRIASTETAKELKNALGQDFGAPEHYRLPENLFDDKFDWERGTRWDETVHPITLARDPEHEDRAFLYIGATRIPFPQDSHLRLNAINRYLGASEENIGRITRIEGGKTTELPAMQRISIPLLVAKQIFDQLAENEVLQDKINIDLWDDDGIDSVEQLDRTVKEAAGVSPVSEKKAPTLTKKTDAIKLTEEDTALMRSNYVAGLKEVIEAQEVRGIAPNIAQAVVKYGDHYRTVIITQMNESELETYNKTNTTERYGKNRHYHKNPTVNARRAGADGNERIRVFTLPGVALHEKGSETEKFLSECELQGIPLIKLNTEKGAGFVDLAEAPSLKEAVDLAMTRFGSQTQAEAVAKAAKSPEELAFDAILKHMYLADVEHPSEERLQQLQDKLSELKVKKADMERHAAFYSDVSDIAKEAAELAGIIPDLPEAMDETHLQSVKIARAIEALEVQLEEWKDKARDEADHARKQEGRTSSVVLAVKVNPDQQAAIEALWKEGGNNPHFIRKPQLYKHALDGKSMMMIYPSQWMMEEMKGYDHAELERKVGKTPKKNQEAMQASLERAFGSRWQKQSDTPVPADQMLDHVREWEGLGPKDPYEQLRITTEKAQLDKVRGIAQKLLERPETQLSPALFKLLSNICDPEQKGKKPLQFAASALILHDIAGQGDAQHIIQSRLDNLEPKIRESVSAQVSSEKEARLKRALEDEDKTTEDNSIRARQEQWANSEIDKRTAEQLAVQKPVLKTALSALTEHGTQGLDRNVPPIEDALETITAELEALKPLLFTENAPAYDEKALEEALDSRLGENDFREYTFERADETRIGKQRVLIIPIKSAESVRTVQSLIEKLGESATQPPSRYTTEKTPSPKEQASARWNAAYKLAQTHIWPFIQSMGTGDVNAEALSAINETFEEYTSLCSETLDNFLKGETILRYAPFKDEDGLKEKLEGLGNTLGQNQRFYQDFINREEREENGETIEHHRVVTEPCESALTDMQGNSVEADALHSLLPNHQSGFAQTIAAERAPTPCVKLYLSDEAFAALSELHGKDERKNLFGNEALEEKIASHNKGKNADAPDRFPTLHETGGAETLGEIIGGLDKPFDSIGLAV